MVIFDTKTALVYCGVKLDGANFTRFLVVSNPKLSDWRIMNNQLFATLVSSMAELNDTQGAQLLSIVNGLKGASVSTKVAKSTASKKSFADKKAKDVTVNMKATKAVVTIDGYVNKDVWTVLKRRFEALGGTYDKATKSITFKTAKSAKEFATNALVSATERENIWKEWAEK